MPDSLCAPGFIVSMNELLSQVDDVSIAHHVIVPRASWDAIADSVRADNELVAKKRNGRKGKRAVEEIYADIGKVVAEFRINRRMSLQDVASQIGMSEAQLSRVESGKSRLMIHDMLRIARVIGVSTAEILRDFEEQES